MKNIKKNKGITLIALIITIVIMLILAIVTIAAVKGEGIIGKAKKAKADYQNAQTEEQGVLDKYLAEMNNLTSDSTQTGEETITWTDNGDETITSSNGVTLKIGDYVDYDPTLEANESDLKYTSLAEKSGHDSNQEFDAATYKNAGYGWRVLGVENGKLRLISEEFVGAGTYTESNRTYYNLKGQKGYINGIEELNNISGIFGHGKGAEGAKSITVEDINAITGYDPEVAKYGAGNFNEYGNKVTYTRGEGTSLSSSATNGLNWSGEQSAFNYYDKETREFKPLTSGSVEITSTSYVYGPATLKDGFTEPTQGVDETGTYNEINQMLFGKYTMTSDSGYYRNFTGTGTQPKYWLASDYADAYDSIVYWGLRDVINGGVSYDYLYDSNDDEGYNSYGVRPVVSLKSNIQLEWNETAGEWKIK